MPGKRKHLTIQQKMEVIKIHDKGAKCVHIATEMQCGKTQIQTIVADKQKIKALWESGSNPAMKVTKVRKTANHELNEQVFEWFCNARSKDIPITGKLIQEKAVMLSVELGLDDFSASNGWLDRFQKRHNISCSVLSGEGASVNEETVNDWCSRLESMCEGYSLKDMFNADETGLFYRALPTRSQVIRGDKCHGGKYSKERKTVLLGCSATGEKLAPLVIGRAANPRCFRGYSTSSCLAACHLPSQQTCLDDIHNFQRLAPKNEQQNDLKNVKS
ncbi:tigger transposable element-derived protein 6-like [Limulus polyphemus]|uniref:Tigger transposable element-derived protein 6-like n=1 Tax=Limulus polyphemus TaxID=6850 RepID=A0ABM1B6C4_LIMPO|nr:tigger transposable element-derived protein 6-like [Limulus polyphemus]